MASVNPPLFMLAWALWDVTPLVFLATFFYGSNLLVSGNLKEDSPEIREGESPQDPEIFRVRSWILMDLITHYFCRVTDIGIPCAVLRNTRPGIYWMFIAFGASYGLNPEQKNPT